MKTLSIRQPWAWLIVHAGKDIENRTWQTKVRGPVLIHAGATMTREDYTAAVIFCSGLPGDTFRKDFFFPTFEQCRKKCGGIVGGMNIVDCVTASPSLWFCGPFGLVIDAAWEMPFIPCKGRLGFFEHPGRV